MASLKKSPTSAESHHWNGCPSGEILWNDISAVVGASDRSMDCATYESGCDGWRRNTVGGGVMPGRERGRISLNICEDVGASFPWFRRDLGPSHFIRN